MEHFKLAVNAQAATSAMTIINNVRFSILTSRVVRLEFSPTGDFEDRPSQIIWHRQQSVPDFTVDVTDEEVVITTDALQLTYRITKDGFTPQTLSIALRNHDSTWHYGQPNTGNLNGTTRTLDGISGITDLETGLLSTDGWTLLDDSQSLVFNDQGWLQPRETDTIDLYFFAYGKDYAQCLRDYFALAGSVPLLPRWALGNWWSRYWEYTDRELLDLMTDFRDHDIPLSVCIVDMDWHITDTRNKSRGWTGYTWNRELFPDPHGFVAGLHELGLKTALNLHPADGIYPHEEQYGAIADYLGREYGHPIPFDIADPAFTQAYFGLLHHPHEELGIDFWWIDWQQGTQTNLPGLDPLWWLNHLHYLDLGRNGQKRPFVFSRWGGLGNHRYPIGFSGDTLVTWRSLAFQPYFTATAANVGFAWWSHDIGGHYFGFTDPELYTRWVQFGVLSPIFRLHSSKNLFQERRPWAFGADVLNVSREAMQLRHRLIPYLYSMSWRTEQMGDQLVKPMYHDYPDYEAAYYCPNQYTFGTELLAAPYIAPAETHTRLTRKTVWMPHGGWFDFFTGQYYPEQQWHVLYGRLNDIPLFAKAGAIVPLDGELTWGSVNNPSVLDVFVFPGADNRFELFEDDGETMAYRNGSHSLTIFTQSWQGNRQSLTIDPVSGIRTHLPQKRSYRLHFRGIIKADELSVLVNGRPVDHTASYDAQNETLSLSTIELTPDDRLEVVLATEDTTLLSHRDRRLETCNKLVANFHARHVAKQQVHHRLPQIVDDINLLSSVLALLEETHIRALVEVILDCGTTYVDNIGNDHQSLIIWNNQNHPMLRYRFSQRTGWSVSSESQVVPSYKVIDASQLDEWRLNVNYADLTMVSYQRSSEQDDR